MSASERARATAARARRASHQATPGVAGPRAAPRRCRRRRGTRSSGRAHGRSAACRRPRLCCRRRSRRARRRGAPASCPARWRGPRLRRGCSRSPSHRTRPPRGSAPWQAAPRAHSARGSRDAARFVSGDSRFATVRSAEPSSSRIPAKTASGSRAARRASRGRASRRRRGRFAPSSSDGPAAAPEVERPRTSDCEDQRARGHRRILAPPTAQSSASGKLRCRRGGTR